MQNDGNKINIKLHSKNNNNKITKLRKVNNIEAKSKLLNQFHQKFINREIYNVYILINIFILLFYKKNKITKLIFFMQQKNRHTFFLNKTVNSQIVKMRSLLKIPPRGTFSQFYRQRYT